MVIPLSGRVPGRTSGPFRSCVDDAGGLQYVFWKIVWAPRVFSSKSIYRRKGDVRGWTRRSHPLVARPRGGPRHHMVWPASGPPPALLWTLSLCQVIGTSAFVSSNSKNISCVTFLKHKNSRKQGTGTVASC
jgi:hypothetical protein